MTKTIADELLENSMHLKNSRNALLARGSTIPSNIGWDKVPGAILTLPIDNSLTIVSQDSNSYRVTVPSSSELYARIDSVGGMTRLVTGVNLDPEASKYGLGATTQVNYEESFVGSPFFLPYGMYRFNCEVVPDVADDCIDIEAYIVTSETEDSLYGGEYHTSGEAFNLYGDMFAQIKVGSATWSNNEEPEITTSYLVDGESNAKEFDTTTAIRIPKANSAEGITSNCKVYIKTNTRVKVTVSDSFYGHGEKEFIIGKGEHEYFWQNEGDSEWNVSIKVEHYIPDMEYIGVTLYPMVYSVPNDSPEWIRTKYEPYTEHIVPTPVNEIVSKGGNLWNDVTYLQSHGFELQSDGMWLGNAQWETIFTNDELREGQISVSYTIELLSIEGTNNYFPIFFYVYYADGTNEQKAPLAYNATGVQYKSGTSSAGKIVTKILWGKSQNATFKIKDIMINWGDSPAPYKPYSAEPIDTVDIPDAVKSDASWGHGFSYTRDGDTSFVANEYDFTEKKYTQYIPEKVTLDGTTGHCFVGNSPVDIPRFYFTLQGKCKDNASVIATNFKTKYADAVGNVYLYKNKAYFFLPSEITTVADANKWLEENPTEMVYAIENPNPTPIDESVANFIKVEGGGEIVFENDANADVPSTITFVRKV